MLFFNSCKVYCSKHITKQENQITRYTELVVVARSCDLCHKSIHIVLALCPFNATCLFEVVGYYKSIRFLADILNHHRGAEETRHSRMLILFSFGITTAVWRRNLCTYVVLCGPFSHECWNNYLLTLEKLHTLFFHEWQRFIW